MLQYGFHKDFLSRLLALVVVDPPFGLRVVSVISPDLLPVEAYGVIFSALRGYSQAEGTLPSRATMKQLLLQKYHGGAIKFALYKDALRAYKKAYVVDPATRTEAKNVVGDAIMDSEMTQALSEAYGYLKNREYPSIFDRIDIAKEKSRALEIGSLGVSLRRDLVDYVAQIRSGAARVNRWPIGVAPLDDGLKGGLGVGELGCILGAEKDGKSMALSHIAATNVLLGRNVLYVSAELDELTIQNRFAANITGILLDSLEKGGEFVADKVWNRISTLFDIVGGDMLVKAFPSGTATVFDIEAHVRDVIRYWGTTPDMIIIDYADELKPSKTSKDSNSYESMGQIYTQLRALGARSNSIGTIKGGFGCPVWTASQVQRQAIGKDFLEFKDVADSILKAAKVDLMVGLCRDENEREIDVVRLYVAACRYAKFPIECGPYARDYEHGRLVRFDSYLRRLGTEWEDLSGRKQSQTLRQKNHLMGGLRQSDSIGPSLRKSFGSSDSLVMPNVVSQFAQNYENRQTKMFYDTVSVE